jgi:hypothetical protein
MKLRPLLHADATGGFETNGEIQCASRAKPKKLRVGRLPVKSIKLASVEAPEFFLATGIETAFDHFFHL